MKPLLAPAQAELLAQLARSSLLVGFDYDGTLAPIVADPERAEPAPTTRRLLCEVARLYPCVVISGRAVSDLEKRLAGVPLRALVGNHGVEPWRASEELRRQVAGWKERLAAPVARLPGVELEDKTYSLALHYRRAPDEEAAREGIVRALTGLGDVRVVGGKAVVNVIPLGAPHKGVAFLRERDRLGCDTAFFVGDDETDEDVFALEHTGRVVTARVGATRVSQASYYLAEQTEIDHLLARLIALRSGTGARTEDA